jgi:hypothetical protein
MLELAILLAGKFEERSSRERKEPRKKIGQSGKV